MSCEYIVTVKYFEQYTRYISLPRSNNQPYVAASSQCAAYGPTWSHIITSGGPFNAGQCLMTDEIVTSVRALNCNEPGEVDGEIPILEPHDNINGTCISARAYKTPGIHPSASACNASKGGSGSNPCSAPNVCCPPPNVCVGADYCPPGTKCLPLTEWNEIQSLAAKNKQVHCG